MRAFSRLLLIYLSIVIGPSPQEVGFLDLTHSVPGHRLHEPNGGSSGSLGAAVIGDRAADDHRKDPLRITLLSFDKSAYRTGETLIYEVKIENVSTEVQVLPWDANIADVEPKKPTQPYEYQSLRISLSFANQLNHKDFSDVTSLYATSEKRESRLQLEPGKWVRVKAKVRLSFHDQLFKDIIASSSASKMLATATVSFSHESVTLQNGHYHEDSVWGPEQSSVNVRSFELFSGAKSD
jgi:hypothetical protein